MTYHEDDLMPISALSQYYYCPRRAGLLLLEQQWSDNIYTIQGTLVHQRDHLGERDVRPDLVRLRAVPLHSLTLGLFGIADCVEFYADPKGCSLKGMEGLWEVVPIEFKHGPVRDELEYEVQLCGQALCLEEMLACKVERGYIYYAADHRRHEVTITGKLRELVKIGAESIHEMLRSSVLPSVVMGGKCYHCSMQEECMPKAKKSAAQYVGELWQLGENGDAQ